MLTPLMLMILLRKPADGTLVGAEERGRGRVQLAVYWAYLKAAGGVRVALLLCVVQVQHYNDIISSSYFATMIACLLRPFGSARQ